MAKNKKTPNETATTASEETPVSRNVTEESATAGRSAANVATIRALAILIALVLIVIAFFLGRASAGVGNSGATGDPKGSGSASAEKTLAAFVAETGLVPGQDFAPSVSKENGAENLVEAAKSVGTPQNTLGDKDAPVTLTVMSDFSCPMCTRWEVQTLPTLEKLAKSGDVKLQWLNLVIFAEQYHSDIAALGAIAAGNQGKLWEFVHAAYTFAGEDSHAEYSSEDVLQIAKDAGVPDLKQFEVDLNSDETEAEMQQQSHVARALGINGTPFFIIGDSVISGAYPTEYFENTIKYQKFLAQR